MMKKIFVFPILLIAANFILWGRTAPTEAATEARKAAPVKAAPAAARVPWEVKWEDTLSKAKKEGTVNVYATWNASLRDAIITAFKKKFGINVEFTPVGAGVEILTKAQAEQRAGLFLADAYGSGAGTIMTGLLKPAGLLGPMRPMLILPEVLDPNAWRGGSLPFVDRDDDSFRLISAVVRGAAYNTDLIKEGELTSAKDILKPQYKGKITMLDPSINTMTTAFLANADVNLWGEAETTKFFSELIKKQGAVVERDFRIHIESVARGKYAIGIGPNAEATARLMGKGAPVSVARLGEDSSLATSTGGIAVPTKFAHPNAAIIFVNWLLTKEGQSLFAGKFGSPSTRADASTTGLNPYFIPEPRKKYYSEDTALINAKKKWRTITKNIISEEAK